MKNQIINFSKLIIIPMIYVYYLRSISFPEKTYVGYTTTIKQRLDEHNRGKSLYTAQFVPWTIVSLFGFDQELKAYRFEKYLKSNAGKIFLKRHCSDQAIIQ